MNRPAGGSTIPSQSSVRDSGYSSANSTFNTSTFSSFPTSQSTQRNSRNDSAYNSQSAQRHRTNSAVTATSRQPLAALRLNTDSHNTPGGDGSAIVCNCGQDAVLLTVRKEGPNTGKSWYVILCKCCRDRVLGIRAGKCFLAFKYFHLTLQVTICLFVGYSVNISVISWRNCSKMIIYYNCNIFRDF